VVESGRICTRCQTWKSEAHFYRRRDKPEYLVGRCRACTSAVGKKTPPPPQVCPTCCLEYQPKRTGRRPTYCSQRCGDLARRRAAAVPRTSRAILVVDDLKRCNKCQEWKPLTDFGLRKDRKSTPLSECRRCSAERILIYSRSDRGRDIRYAYKYGVSMAWYEARLAEQGGVCAICGRPADPNDPKHPRLVVDYCHVSGDTRGLLCFRCNLMLGLSADDEGVLTGAIEYLRRTNQGPQPSLVGNDRESRG
jgi:hypothetical protein